MEKAQQVGPFSLPILGPLSGKKNDLLVVVCSLWEQAREGARAFVPKSDSAAKLSAAQARSLFPPDPTSGRKARYGDPEAGSETRDLKPNDLPKETHPPDRLKQKFNL